MEILFFLISMKGTCYLDKEINLEDLLANFKKVLLNKKCDIRHSKRIDLKLRMFLGSIYEVLDISKLVNNRNLFEEEIGDISNSFWKRNLRENFNLYEWEELKFELL